MTEPTQISLSLKQIYKVLCPKCQKKLRDMIKDRLADQLVEQALQDKEVKGEN